MAAFSLGKLDPSLNYLKETGGSLDPSALRGALSAWAQFTNGLTKLRANVYWAAWLFNTS